MMDLFSYAEQARWSPRQPEPPEGVPTDVAVLFDRLALEIIKLGHKRYSADAILHRIRWHYHIEKGDLDFKCNNNWTSKLSRWFLARHPTHSQFFEIRNRQWKD